jgi:hypothetical protein
MAHPFGALEADARAMVVSTAEGTRPAGVQAAAARPSDATIGQWLDAGGADVAAAIRGYERLAPDPAVAKPGQAELVASIETRAKSLTELYAASMLANVALPERQGKTQLGDTLYARFTDGLKRLTDDVRDELTRLDELEPADVGQAATDEFGPVAQFPAPFLRDAAGQPLRF